MHCRNRKITNSYNGAIHTKKVKRTMRNQFRKPKNVNCANSFFPNKTILGIKCAERSDKHFMPTTFEQR